MECWVYRGRTIVNELILIAFLNDCAWFDLGIAD